MPTPSPKRFWKPVVLFGSDWLAGEENLVVNIEVERVEPLKKPKEQA